MSLKKRINAARLMMLLFAFLLAVPSLPVGVAGVGTQVAEAALGTVDSTWTIVVGSDPLEQTAGEDLKNYWTNQFGVTVQGPVSAASYSGSTKAIRIGTTADHPAIATENSASPFQLSASEPESYHLAYRTDGTKENIWAVGQSAKGAMNGAFRLEDRNSLGLTGLNESGSPAFKNRIAGHLMVQSAPSTWTEDQQAAYYAKNYINVVWGEKYGPPISYTARQKYGLGLALEVKLPPVTDEWKADPANASAVYWRDSWSGPRKVVNPYDPLGRQTYMDAFNQALADNPDTKILYSLFGDYSFTTDHTSTRVSDGAACVDNSGNPCTSEGSIKEVMSIMKQAIGTRDIVPAVWMWHLFPASGDEAFMDELKSLGYGIIYNEASNSDDWLYKEDNFNSLALKTDATGKTKFGDNFMVLVSAGSSCESTDPVIGMPLPHVAASKIRKLADAKIDNFLLWWGSGEGWTYSANMSAIKEMIWTPNEFDPTNLDPFNPANPDPIMNKIAVRDFGSMASSVLDFWKSFDSAVVNKGPGTGIQIYSWNQRLGVFTLPDVFGGGYPEPLIPASLSNKSRFNIYSGWGYQSTTTNNFGTAVTNMQAALDKAWNIRMNNGDPQKVKDMHLWAALFKRIFESQYNMLRGLQITEKYRAADGTVDTSSAALKAELAPVTQAEIANTNSTIAIIQQFPSNFSLSGSSRTAFNNQGNRDKDLEMLKGKAASMQIWLDDLKNLSLDTPITASSYIAADRVASLANDGNTSTLWHSQATDNQWIYVDLGAVKPVKYVKLNWNSTAAASQYKIQLSGDAATWSDAATVTLSTGKIDLITLADGLSARYVKMQGISRASQYGYAINEFEVYGTEKNPAGGGTPATTVYEAESLNAVTSGDARTQFTDANMSGGKGDKLDANAVNDYITYDVNVAAAGTYTVKVKVKKQASRGIFQLSIGGADQGTAQDNYSAADSYVEIDLGPKTFNTAGVKSFKFNITGKNASSTGYTLGLDYIKLIPQ